MALLKRLTILCVCSLPRFTATWVYHKPGNVRIGVLLPIHGTSPEKVCGKLQPDSLGFAETLIYCIELINNNSAISRGITMGYDILDYCESPTLGMKMTHEFVKQNFILDFSMGTCGNNSAHTSYSPNAVKFAHDQLKTPISAVIGAHDSGTTVLVAELLGVVNIPIVSPFSTSEQLSSGYPTFFRTIPPDGLQARAIGDLIAAFNWSYVGVVAVDHSYGRYGAKGLEEEALRKASFCTANVEYFPRLGYQSKMETIIDKLRKQKLVRVIVLWASSSQSLEFLDTAMKRKLHDKVWILSDSVMVQPSSFFDKITERMNGVLLGITHRDYKNQTFQDHLLKMLQTPPKENKLWNEFFEDEFNCTLNETQPQRLPLCDHNKMNFTRALDDLYNPYSSYLVDSVQAIAEALKSMYECDDKVKKCPKTSPYIDSRELVEHLKNVSFQGITGNVGFNKHGNPKSSSYDIIHLNYDLQSKFVKSTIGRWSKENLDINKTMIKWSLTENKPPSSSCMGKCAPGTQQTSSKNCCWECIECETGTVSTEFGASNCSKCPVPLVASKHMNACLEEVIVNLTIDSNTGIIFTAISGFGILCSLISLLVFIKYFTTPLVKASNRELSLALLFIIISGFTLTILHISLLTTNICIFQNVWRYTIHSVCISILFVKTIRLAGAFQLEISGIPQFLKRFIVDSKLQFLTLTILNTCPVTLALLWSLLDNPYVIHRKIEVDDRIEDEISCHSYHGKTGMALQLSSLCYLIIITLACIYHSFKARNLPGNFNETRYIGLSLYILLISWLAYYPINSVLTGWYVAVISNATDLLSWYGLLFCIYGPKIYIILVQPHMNTNEFVRAELRTANARGMNSVSAQSHCTDKN